jgi:hypothetical protein
MDLEHRAYRQGNGNLGLIRMHPGDFHSTPAAAQSQLTALASQKGRCTNLVHAGKVLKPCKNILINTTYSDSRSGFYFTAGNTVLTFSGFGSQQIPACRIRARIAGRNFQPRDLRSTDERGSPGLLGDPFGLAPDRKQGQTLRALRTTFETNLDGAPVRLEHDQAYVLRESLELLSRLHIGQFHFAIEGRATRASPEGAELYHAWLHRCAGSLGIHNPQVSDEARTAWDLYQVIRHHYAWLRNPQGDITVDLDTPRRVGKEPLPAVTRVAAA